MFSEVAEIARECLLKTATIVDRGHRGAVVAQLASARLSEREVPGSIFSDFNVCFDFPLIRVAIALNTRKTEH